MKTISAADLEKQYQSEKLAIVDVRERHEFQAGHIPMLEIFRLVSWKLAIKSWILTTNIMSFAKEVHVQRLLANFLPCRASM